MCRSRPAASSFYRSQHPPRGSEAPRHRAR